jgi:hypothetical protein
MTIRSSRHRKKNPVDAGVFRSINGANVEMESMTGCTLPQAISRDLIRGDFRGMGAGRVSQQRISRCKTRKQPTAVLCRTCSRK